MGQALLERAKAAFDGKDLAQLSELAAGVRSNAFADPDSAKVFNLLGELQRKSGRIAEAVAAYSVAHDPPRRESTAGLYGLAECHAALRDGERFDAAVEQLIAGGKLNANLASRLMVAAATLGREKVVERLAAISFADSDGDAWYWVRRASAAFHLGRGDEVEAFAQKARAAAAGNADVLLAVAEIDYDPSKYWDRRYNSRQGDRAPVPPAWREDNAYAERTAREMAYLRAAFDRAFGTSRRFVDAVDCGCGSGRLTPFLRERANNIDCYDISDTALRYARDASKGVAGLRFRAANLVEESLPAAAYDLVFDFTVVQHQADRAAWEHVLANYAQAARPGGHVFLVEQRGNDGPNKFPHVRNASAASYRQRLIAGGCEVIFDELTPWGEICLVGRRAGA